jgi:hypothetical protein
MNSVKDTCAICIETKKLTCKISQCCHNFCHDCGVKLLLNKTYSCPLCRGKIIQMSFEIIDDTNESIREIRNTPRYFHQPESSDTSSDEDERSDRDESEIEGYSRNDMYPDDDFSDDDNAPLVYDD